MCCKNMLDKLVSFEIEIPKYTDRTGADYKEKGERIKIGVYSRRFLGQCKLLEP